MESHSRGASDLRAQAASVRRRGGRGSEQRFERYYRYVRRLYTGLLLFVVLVGLPIIGVPSLRQRLSSRIETLRQAALTGEKGRAPLVSKVGENSLPFPKEYEIPLTTWAEPRAPFVVRLPVYRGGSAGQEEAAAGERANPASDAEASDAGDAPEFRQGAQEKQAYDVVLQSSEAVAALVAGKEPALRLQKWAAARRGEDVYWVDLTFTRLPENTEARYIYEVSLALKKVTPLSALARSLAAR